LQRWELDAMSDLIPPQKEETGAPLVELLNFSKRFGSFQALQGVSLTVRAGTFHALLGENGAGKSTLVKALIGFHAADTGSTTIDGRERRIDNQRDAARLGIGMIFQHFTVAPGMTVAENLTLADRELSALIDWKRERARLAAFMKTAPFPLPLDRMVAGLAAGEKQKLEILKQLYTKRRFLILDEPTSVLTPLEADEVLGRLKAMAQAGEISVLMITHKFREVFGVCDDVTVLRRGRLTGQGRVDALDRDKLAAWMMGADIALAAKAEASLEAGAAAPAPAPASSASVTGTLPRLRVVGLRVESDTPGLPAIHDLSLEVRPGEIVGIAGVSGNGQSELVAALTGVLPMTAGHLTVDGYPYRPQRESMRRLHIASLPEEPLHNGCVGRMSVEENLAFRNFDCPPLTESARAPGRWWLSHRRMRAQALERIAGFKVKTTGPQAPMASLSGGNVQRAVLARELSQTPRLLIVANPCFGLDFQAAAEIHGRLRDARDAGCAVLLISEDLDELLALSTRLLVLSHGRIAYETALTAAAGVPPPVDIAAIGRAMAGDSHAAAVPLAA
jgi:general nucleoside transport system ATP-binding protein